MNQYRGTRGDVQAAVSVMLEAARWLEDCGMPLWTQKEIKALPQMYPAQAFLTLYAGNTPAAAALLTETDSLFWPDVPPGSSGFLHKLSVRRCFAGKGLAQRMMDYAALVCKSEGMQFLRLDCDASREKLKSLYVSAGFCYICDRTVQTQTHGTVTAALFARPLSNVLTGRQQDGAGL